MEEWVPATSSAGEPIHPEVKNNRKAGRCRGEDHGDRDPDAPLSHNGAPSAHGATGLLNFIQHWAPKPLSFGTARHLRERD